MIRETRKICSIALMALTQLNERQVFEINRALRGRHPFRAHRSHVYQRLVVAGATHTCVTLVYTAGMALCAGGAFAARATEGRLDALIFWGVVGVSLILTLITVTRIRASTTER